MILYAKNICTNLIDLILNIKNAWPFKLAVAAITYFAGIHLYIIAIIALSLLDVITGIWAAKKEGIEITSRKLRKGLLEKVALYMILLLSSFIVGKVLQSVIHYNTFYISWLLTVLISVYEITSVIENTIKIYPNLAFLSKLSAMLNKVADKQIENAEEILEAKPEEKKSDKKAD